MMHELYIVLFLLSDALCFLSLLWIRKYEHRLRKVILQLLGISCFTITMYLMTIISSSVPVMKFFYYCYFASMDWLCGSLFYFTLQFTNFGKLLKIRKVMIPIFVIDSVSMISSYWLNHMVSFKDKLIGHYMYLIFEPKWPFNVHLGICYVLIFGLFILLISRIITEPKIQKVQYITVFLILFLLVLVNGEFLYSGIDVDISILAYGIGAVLVSYYTIFFVEKQLLSKMSSVLTESLNKCILLFDNNGNLIYENAEAKDWDEEKGTDKESIFHILKIGGKDEKENFYVERTIKTKSGIRHIRIDYSPLLEENRKGRKRVIGSYIVIENIDEQIKRMENREYTITHDNLTGMYNRNYFFEQVPILIEQNPDVSFSIFMTNIYQFNLYNEIFGFEAGNALLRKIGSDFLEKVTSSLAICARYDGDRFVACVPSEFCTSENFQKYQALDLIGNERYKIVNYIGIYQVPNESDISIATMCERAAMALNTIKGEATKRWAFFDTSMRDELIYGRNLVNSFENALKNHEFTIYVQPQIDHDTNSIVGGEVLARWINSEGKNISPEVFIPVLEQHGLVTELDKYIWERAFQLAKDMEQQGIPISLSVNISTQDLYYCDIYQVFTGLSKKYNLPSKYIKLEITESLIMSDMEKQIELIKKLQDSGFIIEMDDFGSGYSSLNSLKDIPIDILKMDLRFFEETQNLEKSQKIMKTVFGLGKALDIPIIAEGVETIGQADYLKKIGGRYIQGYLYGKPMPVDEFITYRNKYAYGEIK